MINCSDRFYTKPVEEDQAFGSEVEQDVFDDFTIHTENEPVPDPENPESGLVFVNPSTDGYTGYMVVVEHPHGEYITPKGKRYSSVFGYVKNKNGEIVFTSIG